MVFSVLDLFIPSYLCCFSFSFQYRKFNHTLIFLNKVLAITYAVFVPCCFVFQHGMIVTISVIMGTCEFLKSRFFIKKQTTFQTNNGTMSSVFSFSFYILPNTAIQLHAYFF